MFQVTSVVNFNVTNKMPIHFNAIAFESYTRLLELKQQQQQRQKKKKMKIQSADCPGGLVELIICNVTKVK